VSIGEVLAEARHQAGLSVLQVSEQTRIRPTIIRGIEADDYSVCGGDFYARGDIRIIAEVVGADPQPLIAEYDRAYRATGPVAASSLDELLTRSKPERRRQQRRPRGLVWALGLAVVVVLGFVGYELWGNRSAPAGTSVAANSQASQARARTSGGPGSPAAAQSASASASAPSSAAPSPSAPAHPPAHAMAVASASAFGPHSGDNPQDAQLVIDGQGGTAWHTDWYTTPRFGNLYPGTGLLLDMGRPVTITAVRVTLGPAAGAIFQIRVGDRPRLRDLSRVARSAGPGGMIRLRLHSPAHGRYVLVWFTKLPPDPAGTFKAAVFGVAVKGWH
jgi:cytoskeletal protein RodZ